MNPREEAKQIISGIVTHQKNADDKMLNIEKQVADLKVAQQKLIESDSVQKYTVANDENGLSHYIEKNGDVRLTKSRGMIRTPNGDRPVMKAGLLDDTEYSCQWHADFVKMASVRQMIRMCQQTPYTPKMDVKLQKHLNKAPKVLRPSIMRVFNDSAGEGAEFIPDKFLPDLYQTFKIPNTLRSVLNTIDVDQGSTLLVPRLNRGGRPYIKGKLTQDDPLSKYTASTVSTGQASITLKGFATLYNIDDAAAEDSMIPLMPLLARQIAQDLEAAYEDCMINGDTAAAHADAIASWDPRNRWGATGLGGASDHRRAFLGFRQASFDQGTTSAMGATLTYAQFMALRYNLGELGSSEVVCVVSPEVYIKYILGMAECATVSNYGQGAAVLSGEIAQVGGVPIISSRFLTSDLAATGLYTGVGTTSGIIMFQRDSWINYSRKAVLVEQSKDIASGAIQLVSTMRGVMASPDAGTVDNVTFGINL